MTDHNNLSSDVDALSEALAAILNCMNRKWSGQSFTSDRNCFTVNVDARASENLACNIRVGGGGLTTTVLEELCLFEGVA